MEGEAREVLIVHEPHADVLPPSAQVIQKLPPRITVASVPAAAVDELARRPGVREIFEGAVPVERLDQLAEPERTFAEAWGLRRRPKERPGEGLAWDAPGFKAP